MAALEEALTLVEKTDERYYAAELHRHIAAQYYEGASVFWIRRMAAIDGEETAIRYWQSTREQTKRGIVEVIGHD